MSPGSSSRSPVGKTLAESSSGIRAVPILGPIDEGPEASATAMEFLASEMEVHRNLIYQQSSRMDEFAEKLKSMAEEFKSLQELQMEEFKAMILGIQQTIISNATATSSSVNKPVSSPRQRGPLLETPNKFFVGHSKAQEKDKDKEGNQKHGPSSPLFSRRRHSRMVV